MARTDSDSGAAAAAAPQYVVYVDTSFDTHLALAVSDFDTVSDLKRKTIQAHQLCFPKFGEIKIDTVKVKRKGNLYHLFDSMLVISAFNGVKRNWFVSVDASRLVESLPFLAIADAPSNAVAEIGSRHDVRETVDALETGSALQGLKAVAERHCDDGSNGEASLSIVKEKRLRDEGSPLEISKKRRKMKSQAPDPPNSADSTLPPYGEDDDGLVQKAGAEMNNLDADKEKSQIAAQIVDENGSLPLVINEHVKEMDVGIPSVGDVALVNNHVSETGDPHKNEMLLGNDANVDAEKVSVAHAVDTGKNVENIVSPKRRKKSSKAKSSAGQKFEMVNPENREGSLGYDSLVESQQAVNYDQHEDRLNEKKNLSVGEGKEITVMDANKESAEENGIEMGLSREITKNADIYGQQTKKSNKRRTSKAKSVDQTSGQKLNEERMDEMGSLQHISDKIVVDGNDEEKIQKKTRKWSSKEKDDESKDKVGKDQSYLSQAEGRDIQAVGANDKEQGDEMGQSWQFMLQSADAGNLEEKTKKKTTRRSSKEKNADTVDKAEANSSREEGGKIMATVNADNVAYGEEDDGFVQKPDAEMNDLDVNKKRSQIAAHFVDENLPLEVEEHAKEMDGGIPSVGDAALVNNKVSETGHAHKNEMLLGNGANVGTEEDSVAHVVDTERNVENIVSPKKRRKSSKAKSSAGEKLERVNPANHEGSLGYDSLVVSQEGANFDQSENRLNEKNNLPEREGKEIAAVDANKESGEVHGIEMGLSREIAEYAEMVGEKAKKSNKRRTSKEKIADHKPNEERLDEMGSLQHTSDVAAVENAEEMIQKKKTRRRSSKEKKDDQSNDKVGEDQSYLSQSEGRDIQPVDANEKETTQKSADAGNLEEKAEKRTTRQSSKGKNDKAKATSSQPEMEQTRQVTEKSVHADDVKDKLTRSLRRSSKDSNVEQSTDGIDKEEAGFHAEGGEAVVTAAADDISYESNGNDMEHSSELTERSARADVGKEKRKRKTRRQSSREKNADQSSDRINKDQSYISQVEGEVMAASKKPGENGNEGQSSLQIVGKPMEANNNDENTQERTKDLGVKDKDIDLSSDITQKEKTTRSQGAGREKAAITADKNSNQHPTDNNEEHAEKRTKGKQSSKKNTRSSRETKQSTSAHSAQKEDTSNLGNLARTTKGKKSAATSLITETDDQNLRAAQGRAKAAIDTPTGSNSTLAPVQSLEANNESIPLHEVADALFPGNHADEVNNPVDELPGRENINFRDYFVPRQSQQEVAASGNSLVSKGPKEDRAGNAQKVKSGKRKPASSSLASSLQHNEQTDEESSRLSKSDKLNSPVKKLRKTPVSGSQASAFPKPKMLEFNGNLEKEKENSAAFASDLKDSKKPKRASKSNSSVDRFHVAFRKPSNKNMGETVYSSERKRNLFSFPGAIFKEESSGSSKDDGDDNSDASTRTPSDNLLSDFSDSDDSGRDYRNSKRKSSLKDVKGLSIKNILRSSSGYKKARLAAVSQLDDSESQQIDFVPDSQTNL